MAQQDTTRYEPRLFIPNWVAGARRYGNLAALLADVELTAEGTYGDILTGGTGATLADASLAATGVLSIEGAVAATLDDAVLAGVATLAISGAVTATLDGATLVSFGGDVRTGELAATLADLTLSASGVLPIAGSVTATLGDVTLAGAGTLEIEGGLSATLAAATLDAAGVNAIEGALTVTLADVTLESEAETGSAEIEMVATAVANNGATTITIPASAQEGDLAILAEYAADSSGTGPPAGWNSIEYFSFSTQKSTISWKVLGSGDPGTAIAGILPGSNQESAAMVVFRNVDALGPTISDVENAGTNDLTDPSATTIPLGDDTISGPAIAIGITQGYSISGDADMTTNPFDASVTALGASGNIGLELGWTIIQSGAAANLTFDQGDSGIGNRPRGFYIT